MSGSFSYQVRGTHEGTIQVTIRNFRWEASVGSFMWLAAWTITSYELFDVSVKLGALAFFAAMFSAVMAWFGFCAFVRSSLRRTIFLSATELWIRSSFSGIRVTRRFRLDEVCRFGFGRAFHSCIPVLKLEARDESKPNRRTKWIILASWVTKEQVEEFLQTLRACGFILPQ